MSHHGRSEEISNMASGSAAGDSGRAGLRVVVGFSPGRETIDGLSNASYGDAIDPSTTVSRKLGVTVEWKRRAPVRRPLCWVQGHDIIFSSGHWAVAKTCGAPVSGTAVIRYLYGFTCRPEVPVGGVRGGMVTWLFSWYYTWRCIVLPLVLPSLKSLPSWYTYQTPRIPFLVLDTVFTRVTSGRTPRSRLRVHARWNSDLWCSECSEKRIKWRTLCNVYALVISAPPPICKSDSAPSKPISV